MSRRSSSPHHHRHHSRRPQGRVAPRGAGFRRLHARRHPGLGPIAFWVGVGTLVIMAVWTTSTATYFAFREDVLTRLIARQAEMQFGYEDRIAELRAQVDRFSSRQLLDQEQYEQKLDQILRRQTALESRASALNGLSDTTGAISLRRSAAGRASRGRSRSSHPTTRAPSSSRSIAPRSILAPAFSPKARAASAASSHACSLRSIASNSARRQWSTRSQTITIRRRGACAAC